MIIKFVAYFKIIRPLNFLITFFSVTVAALICTDQPDILLPVIAVSFSAALIGSGGNVINDYFDVEIDRINRPDRAMPSGILTKTEGLVFYFILTLSGILLSITLNFTSFVIASSSAILIYLYSFRLKKIPLAGNILVAVITGMAFIYGGSAVNNVSDAVIPAVFALLINLIREILKDIEDIKGDKELKVSTFPQIYGISKSRGLIVSLVITLILFTLYPFLFEIYKIEYFLIVMIVVNTALIYFLKKLYEDVSSKSLRKLSGLLKFVMIAGLAAIYLGAS